jgi:hypothetical protein
MLYIHKALAIDSTSILVGLTGLKFYQLQWLFKAGNTLKKKIKPKP